MLPVRFAPIVDSAPTSLVLIVDSARANLLSIVDSAPANLTPNCLQCSLLGLHQFLTVRLIVRF